MKAPDKIYTDNRGVYAELPIFSQADANVEYIRKDALMEWLDTRVSDYGHTTPFRIAIQCTIDKLNSL